MCHSQLCWHREAALSDWNADYPFHQLSSSTSVTSIMLITDFILLHQKKYPMHPAIPLTFDLLTWMALLSMAVIECLLVGWTFSNDCDYADPGEKCWASFVANMRNTGLAMMFFAL